MTTPSGLCDYPNKSDATGGKRHEAKKIRYRVLIARPRPDKGRPGLFNWKFMEYLSTDSLTTKLVEFVTDTGCCLFAGAGVSSKANLPTWNKIIDNLGVLANRYEVETGDLIRRRLLTNHLLDAATIFFECPIIPKGIKYQAIPQMLEKYDCSALHSLLSMPFAAIVTTNYDRAIHDAYVSILSRHADNNKAPKLVEIDDASMQRALFWNDFFIARLHGRVEIPESLVFTKKSYENINQNPAYIAFLKHIFSYYRVLFLGFSFLDPAIDNILSQYEKEVSQPYPKAHLAILPANAPQDLVSKLALFNIEVQYYDEKNNHASLWSAINLAQKEVRSNPRQFSKRPVARRRLGRFLASCYSRLSIDSEVEPLREIVLEGLIMQAVSEAGDKGISKEKLFDYIRCKIGVTSTKTPHLIDRAIIKLEAKKLCIENADKIFCLSNGNSSFDEALTKLATGVKNRLKVREGINDSTNLTASLIDIISILIINRGWDLGAHFAGGNLSTSFEAWEDIDSAINEFSSKCTEPIDRSSIANAILDLFKHPDDSESEIICDLSRVSFGVEMVVGNSASLAEPQTLIPDRVYLDTNVVMPAIVDGHPFSPIYKDTVDKMTSFANKYQRNVAIFVLKSFLNEIISHKQLALEEVNKLKLENPDTLHKYILMLNAENTNVFIGAYSSWVGRLTNKISFREFLVKTAPYNTEEALATYLNTQQIQTIDPKYADGEPYITYISILNELQTAYEKLRRVERYTEVKAKVLVEHEATQLTKLLIDANEGKNPIFVTADKQLMAVCQSGQLKACSKYMVSHIGFVQLLDLVLGLGLDKRSMSRLLWGVELSNSQLAIRNYLIDLALRHYDEALAMAMWDVVDKIAEKASIKASQERVSLSPRNPKERARTAAFMDRFEQDFFSNMAQVITDRQQK